MVPVTSTTTTELRRPAISVVMPAYRRPDKVRRAVASVLEQTFQDWELVIVDDASPDSLADALDELARDRRVRVIRHRTNRGGSAARNTGILASSAKVIALLDSDDRWLPEKLAGDTAFIARQNGSHWFGFGQYWIDSINGRRESAPAPQRMPRLDEYLFVQRGAMQTSSLLLPAVHARRVLFDETLPRLQDWDFVLRLWLEGLDPRPIPVRATIYDAPDDVGRISSRLDPDFLLTWLEERRSWLSDTAAVGFESNKVAPELIQVGRRYEGVQLLLRGLRSGVVSRRSMGIELLRAALGDRAFRRVLGARRRIAGT